jgi:hypothetical protein
VEIAKVPGKFQVSVPAGVLRLVFQTQPRSDRFGCGLRPGSIADANGEPATINGVAPAI